MKENETLTDYFKKSIIDNLCSALLQSGITPENDLLDRLENAALEELTAVAIAFPAYIVSKQLVRNITPINTNKKGAH